MREIRGVLVGGLKQTEPQLVLIPNGATGSHSKHQTLSEVIEVGSGSAPGTHTGMAGREEHPLFTR